MKLSECLSLATYPEANAPKIASNAVSLARQMTAALHGVAVNVHIPDVSNALSRYLLDLPGKIREVTATRRKCGKTLLEAVANSQGDVTLTTQEIAAPPALIGEVATKQCLYFDLRLVGLAADNPTARMTGEAVLFGAGRPMLLLPGARDVGKLDHVVIRWDRSRVAARAIADARPFLERAAKVVVVSVIDEKPLPGKEIPERVADGLRTRGLTVETGSIQAGDRLIGAARQEHSLKIGGKLLVMMDMVIDGKGLRARRRNRRCSDGFADSCPRVALK